MPGEDGSPWFRAAHSCGVNHRPPRIEDDRRGAAAAVGWRETGATVDVKRRAGKRSSLASSAIAGLPGAVSSVPDGMAAAVLVGVNPIHGLYAGMAGPTVGGLTTSTRLMVITTTSAAALAAGSAVAGYAPEDRPAAVFLLTITAAC
jgi:sulfate permease, SulP family